MNQTNPSFFGQILFDEIKRAVKEALSEVGTNGHSSTELLTVQQLADKLKLPRSWVYEQSRRGQIPTHRIGKYIRFDLREVLESQKEKLTQK